MSETFVHARAKSIAWPPLLPDWIKLSRQYLAGSARAGWQAKASLHRWNKRHGRTLP
jgi:hypothetical protein